MVLCALLLIRGASESAVVNTVMVCIKLGVLGLFSIIAFTAFTGRPPRELRSVRRRRPSVRRRGTIFFSFIGLDAVSTAGDEVKDPQTTMPRAMIAALVIVTGVYVLVALAAIGAQQLARLFDGQDRRTRARSSTTSPAAPVGSTVLAAGAVISIFSVTLVTLYGQTRILFAMGRDGLLPAMFAKVDPQHA